MAGLSDLFGKDSIGQQFLLWNVGAELAAALLAPMLQSIESQVWSLDPSLPLSPQILAELAARGITTEGHAADEAAKTGTGGENFRLLLAAAEEPLGAGVLADMVARGLVDEGTANAEAERTRISPANFNRLLRASEHAPDISFLMEAVRRGTIAETGSNPGTASLEEGLRDAGIRPEYWSAIKSLLVQIPTVAEVMNAWLEGQIDETEAHRRYLLAGGDPTWFQTSYNANGQAPTPDMLGVMLNRGIIPQNGTGPRAVSYEQGFLEGPWRNKWLSPMLQLREYLPPPRTVTALIHEGAIDAGLALQLFEKEGLSPELAKVYVDAASHTKAAATKNLTKAEILTLYKDRLITEAETVAMLETLGYDGHEANYEIAAADFSREVKLLNGTMSKVHSMYVAHKISKAAATADLHALQVPSEYVDDIFRHWDIEVTANIKPLTEAQISAAFKHNILSQDEAATELGRIGITPFDAWVILSIANGEALDGKPSMPIPPERINP